jgi:hypothetical protein
MVIYSFKTIKLMKIKDIKVGMSNINVEASVVDKSNSRSVQTKYGRREIVDIFWKMIQEELKQVYGRIK